MLENFEQEQETKRAVQKYPRLNPSVHYGLRNCKRFLWDTMLGKRKRVFSHQKYSKLINPSKIFLFHGSIKTPPGQSQNCLKTTLSLIQDCFKDSYFSIKHSSRALKGLSLKIKIFCF